MRIGMWLLILSLGLIGVGLVLPGPAQSDWFVFGGTLGTVAVILLFRRWAATASRGPHILVDGSNVMHWNDQTPQIVTVLAVVQELRRRGFVPGVIFDANAGYKLMGRYQDDAHFAKMLNLPVRQVLMVPKGTQADSYLLETARDLGARVVTNDRFRDWVDAHPQVREPGFLIRGGFRDGGLWLDEAALTRVAA